MSRTCPEKDKIDEMTAGERISKARDKCDQMWHHIVNLIQVRENNEFIIYRDDLVDKIPPSRARNAFEALQYVSLIGELVSICALWDGVKETSCSIPTIGYLIDDINVKRELKLSFLRRARSLALKAKEKSPASTLLSLRAIYRRELHKQTLYFDTHWRDGVDLAKSVKLSALLQSVTNCRNTEIAHYADGIFKSTSTKGKRRIHYRDEIELLKRTEIAATSLSILCGGPGPNYAESHEIASHNAGELWGGCTFNIPDYRIGPLE